MALTAYRDRRSGLTTPERGCYPEEPDPKPGDEDYAAEITPSRAWRIPRLLPAKFFRQENDTPLAPEAEGRRSRAVTRRIASSCAGWEPPHPTASEFYDAIRAERPSARQEALVLMWLNEASERDVYAAHYQGAYTWRLLAAAARRIGQRRSPVYRVLNTNSTWSADLSVNETWSEETRETESQVRES